MAVGAIHTLVICAPAEFTQSPCPAGHALATVEGYVIDPSRAESVEQLNQPFDYSAAAAIWGLAFSFVVALYLVSRSAGTIVQAIRNL